VEPAPGAGTRGEHELVRVRAEQRQAQSYAEFFAPVTQRFAPFVQNTLPASARLVADLGAGGGAFARALAASGRRCVAVDHAIAMLAECRGRGTPAVVADASVLPFADGSLDAVAATFLLPHVPDWQCALAAIVRVLRPGGVFVQASWAGAQASPFTGLAARLLASRGSPAVRAILEDAERRTTVRWVSEQARAAGFADVQVETLSTTVAVESPSRWWRGMIGASTGLSQLLHMTGTDVRRDLQEEFLEAAQTFRRGSELTVPVAAHVLWGVR
jgi:ubiquinone/menaquinone biosynthesis C-methylase UbiE